ncbi:MAG: IS1595 family transposase [Acidobacteria bacterium]|nr:IS1595 family transposase [Acidobacteriota bacterium]
MSDGVEGPRPGVDYPESFRDFQEWFSSENSCRDYLTGLRWPDGFVCPRCGSSDYWRMSVGSFMCKACNRQTSVTAGTLFDKTRTPLTVWFAAAWFITSQKNGVSALGLQRVLGLKSYETAWVWMHKFRRAMVPSDRLLSGTVELDETFVGGVTAMRPGRGSLKTGVMIATEMITPHKHGRIRLQPTPREEIPMVKFAERVIAPGSLIKTDGARELRRLSQMGYGHEYFTQLGSPTPAHINLPGVHRVASLLKRWLEGTLHSGISDEQLQYYLDEFTFRFNRRSSRSRGLLFYRLLTNALTTDPHPMRALVAADPEPGTT